MGSRRNFIKTSLISGAGIYTGFNLIGCSRKRSPGPSADLYQLTANLLQEWGERLLDLQVKTGNSPLELGGIMCPACGRVHGRMGDAIYPFLFLAEKNKDSRYLDGAVMMFDWMERNVSQPDGSWLNEATNGTWKGITVFGAVALAEALKNHGKILDRKVYDKMMERLRKSGNFMMSTFTLEYGNINYPISASYGLALLGEILDEPKFREKGKYFAHEALRFLTPKDKFIFGEGKPVDIPSNKGCFPIDLGYNVEESLPSLVQYGLLTGDNEVLDAAVESLKTHMEFLLPDGGWDNSWGTRNFKWTYWGSRTSDGCQPAFALLADKDPRFYKAALKNTQQLKDCTSDRLLHGGPHYHSHGILPCVHHTFCHTKALATVLNHQSKNQFDPEKIKLPRETAYGVKSFADNQTWLVSKGKYRATITGYDCEYSMKNGHATGGALSMLWHELAGPVFTASMNKYQLVEEFNMQPDNDPDSITLTPRFELIQGKKEYKNINDLAAGIRSYEEGGKWIVETSSKLVDENQESPASGAIPCKVKYIFSDEKVILKYSCDFQGGGDLPQIIFPVISKQSEPVKVISEKCISVDKGKCTLKISADQIIHQIPIKKKRVFNFVPGLEAIPLMISSPEAEITVEVV